MKTALVLGACSDIAAGLAEILAREKWDLLLASRDMTRMKEIQNELVKKYHNTIRIFSFDAIFPETHLAFYNGLPVRPDLVVCAFGYLGNQKLAEKDPDESELILRTNYSGAVSILNIIANDFESHRAGTIIGISSVAGDRGRGSHYIYGSAKAGFTAYLSGLRNRMAKKNVHVMTVKPGFVRTKMTWGIMFSPRLTSSPAMVAVDIYHGFLRKHDIVYTPWFWRYIMLAIRNIPEVLFKRMSL